MNNAELLQGIADLKAQADKAKGEILGKIQALEDAVANAGTTSPEVDAAFAELRSSLQGLDDVVPDTAAPAPAPEEPQA